MATAPFSFGPVPADRRQTSTQVDPRTSPYFGMQDAGSGSFSMGGGAGAGFLPGMQELPGADSWYTPASGSGANEQPGSINPTELSNWLNTNQYSLRMGPGSGSGMESRWLEDASGNYVVQPFDSPSDTHWGRDFAQNALGLYYAGTGLEAALAAGGSGAAAGGGGTEAAAAGAGTAPSAAAPAAGTGTTAGTAGTTAGGATAGATAGGTTAGTTAGQAAAGGGFLNTLQNSAGNAAGNLAVGAVAQALGPDAPATPDFQAAAAQQGQDNLQAALVQNQMNRVDTTTPFGSQTFNRVADPNAPGGYRYTSNITLSPEQQALYQAETSNQIGMQNLAGQLQGRVGEGLAAPFSLGSVGDAARLNSDPNAFSAERDQLTQAMYDRATRLRQPQMDRDRAALDTKLKNQGLMPGTEAYDVAMKSLLDSQAGELQDMLSRSIEAGGTEQSRLQSDLRQNSGFNNQVRSQGIQELLLQRQQPLTEFNSLRTGNTPTLPQFQPFGMANVQPTPSMQGAQLQYGANADAYNARLAQYQNLLNFGTRVVSGP
jgi:hypothetical protein